MPTKGTENEGGTNLVSPRWPLNKGDEKGSRARPSLHISSPSSLGSSRASSLSSRMKTFLYFFFYHKRHALTLTIDETNVHSHLAAKTTLSYILAFGYTVSSLGSTHSSLAF